MAEQKKGDRSSRSRSGKSTPSQRSPGSNEGNESRREHGGRDQDGDKMRSDRDRQEAERERMCLAPEPGVLMKQVQRGNRDEPADPCSRGHERVASLERALVPVPRPRSDSRGPVALRPCSGQP